MTRRHRRRALLVSLSILSAIVTFVFALGLMGFAQADARSARGFGPTLERTAEILLETAQYEDLQAQVERTVRPVRESLAREAAEGRHDPYRGWQTWCESRPTPCKVQKDCTPDRNGQPRKCLRPWWSKIEKVCAIDYASRAKRKVLEDELQRTVAAQCRGRCNATELGKFMALVAMRESTLRPWKRHSLEGDVRLAEKNWTKAYKRMAPVNPHYADPDRWDGLGLLGQQSVTFVPSWDQAAPPELLCRRPVAVATYLHCMRVTHRKQTSLGIPPTWETLHASCSGGKVRPKKPSLDFRKRAARVDLDPDQRVPLVWLGTSPGKSVEVRNMTLALIDAAVALRAAQI